MDYRDNLQHREKITSSGLVLLRPGGLILLRAVVISAIVIGFWTTPDASADEGWYISGNAGASIFRDTDASDTLVGVGLTGTGTVEGDEGFFVSGAVGYSWGMFRIEGEVLYQKSDLDSANMTAGSFLGGAFSTNIDLAVDGDVSSLGFMANGWFDIDTGTKWTPFIGGGVGISRQEIDLNTIAGLSTLYNQDDAVFSYQAGVGLRYSFTDSTSVGLSYRYFASQDAKFDDGTEKVEAEYSSHIVSLGIIHRF